MGNNESFTLPHINKGTLSNKTNSEASNKTPEGTNISNCENPDLIDDFFDIEIKNGIFKTLTVKNGFKAEVDFNQSSNTYKSNQNIDLSKITKIYSVKEGRNGISFKTIDTSGLEKTITIFNEKDDKLSIQHSADIKQYLNMTGEEKEGYLKELGFSESKTEQILEYVEVLIIAADQVDGYNNLSTEYQIYYRMYIFLETENEAKNIVTKEQGEKNILHSTLKANPNYKAPMFLQKQIERHTSKESIDTKTYDFYKSDDGIIIGFNSVNGVISKDNGNTYEKIKVEANLNQQEFYIENTNGEKLSIKKMQTSININNKELPIIDGPDSIGIDIEEKQGLSESYLLPDGRNLLILDTTERGKVNIYIDGQKAPIINSTQYKNGTFWYITPYGTYGQSRGGAKEWIEEGKSLDLTNITSQTLEQYKEQIKPLEKGIQKKIDNILENKLIPKGVTFFSSPEYKKELIYIVDNWEPTTQKQANIIKEAIAKYFNDKSYPFDNSTKIPESFVGNFKEESGKIWFNIINTDGSFITKVCFN